MARERIAHIEATVKRSGPNKITHLSGTIRHATFVCYELDRLLCFNTKDTQLTIKLGNYLHFKLTVFYMRFLLNLKQLACCYHQEYS